MPPSSADELELSRRQLEQSWRQLRREQMEFQEARTIAEKQIESERREIQEREQAMTLRLHAAEEIHHHDARRRMELEAELTSLENRIHGQRRNLLILREEANRLETPRRGLEPEKDPGLSDCGNSVSSGAPPFTIPISEILELLLDQARCLAEEHAEITAHREALNNERVAATEELARRRADLDRYQIDLDSREQEVHWREHDLSKKRAALTRLEHELECNEARLACRQHVFEGTRERLVAELKARIDATKEQVTYLAEVRHGWDHDRWHAARLVRRIRKAWHEAKSKYLRLQESLRCRLVELDERERRIMQSEFIVRDAQQELLMVDADPVGAEQELARRQQAWEQLADRRLAAARHADHRQVRQSQRLRHRSERLQHDRLQLEAERVECNRLLTFLQNERAESAVGHIGQDHDIHALKAERMIHLRQIQELKRQVEKLALTLMDTDRTPPPLAIAA